MSRNVAEFISYFFHPLAMPLYALLLFSFTDPYFELFLPSKTKWTAFLVFTGMTFVGPLLLLSIYRKMGTINSFSDPNKSSRIMVASVILIFYFVTYYLFKKLQLSSIYYQLFLAIIMAICLATFITFFYKISMHGLAVGGILGAQLAFFFIHGTYNTFLLILIILICGLVGTARLALKAHNAYQVYWGYLLGAVVVASFILWKG